MSWARESHVSLSFFSSLHLSTSHNLLTPSLCTPTPSPSHPFTSPHPTPSPSHPFTSTSHTLTSSLHLSTSPHPHPLILKGGEAPGTRLHFLWPYPKSLPFINLLQAANAGSGSGKGSGKGSIIISPVIGGKLRIHERVTVRCVGVDKPRILVILLIFQLWNPLKKVDSLYHIWKPFTSSFQVKRYTYQQIFLVFLNDL